MAEFQTHDAVALQQQISSLSQFIELVFVPLSNMAWIWNKGSK